MKKEKETIPAKVLRRWGLCMSVFGQSIIEAIELDEVSCRAFIYGSKNLP
jgi:hypothetical protein